MDLTEKMLTEERIFKGTLLDVRRDVVELPNGRSSTREFIRHPGAVVIIPFTNDSHVIMEKQFRYPSHQVFLEFPAGKIDPGEGHEETGRRELLEETGYEAAEFEYVGKLHPGIGYSDEIIYIYVARQLVKKEIQRDRDEFMEIFEISLDEAYQQMLDGHITDAKTMISLFWAKHHLL